MAKLNRSKSRSKVKVLEENLSLQISELRQAITDARHGCSIIPPKTIDDYRRDRELSLRPLLAVPEIKPFQVQSEILKNQCDVCLKSEYSPTNLAILFHQFFCDQMSELVQLKHMFMVRWTRFSAHSQLVENVYKDFQQYMKYIMARYDDALHRARRLSAARDYLLANKSPPASLVQCDDVLIYLQWLVYHLHTTKMSSAYLTLIHWLPQLHMEKLGTFIRQAVEVGPNLRTSMKQAEKTVHQTEWETFNRRRRNRLGAQQHGDNHAATFESSMLSNTTPLVQASKRATVNGNGNATSASYQSTNIDEDNLFPVPLSQSVPHHSTDTSDLKILLQHLLNYYSINVSAEVTSYADELQLYYHATKKFRSVHQKQEHQFHCPTYGSPLEPDSSGPSSNRDHSHHGQKLFRKHANWLLFVTLKPDRDPQYVMSLLKMRDSIKQVDPLLSVHSKCLHLRNVQRAIYALKQHATVVRTQPKVHPVSVTSHKTAHDSMLIWKALYQGLDTRDPRKEDKTEDEKTHDDFGDMNSLHSTFLTSVPGYDSNKVTHDNSKDGMDVSSALKLISHEEGRKISSKAHSVIKDAYFAFLLLRHIRIRDLMIKCLYILNYFRSIERTITINCEGLSLELNTSEESKLKRDGNGLISHAHLHHTPADYIVSEHDFMTHMEVENHDDYYTFETDGRIIVSDSTGTNIIYDAALVDLRDLESELLIVGSYYIMKNVVSQPDESMDIPGYSQKNTDRFGVLLDLWACELGYLEKKKKLVDCYLEAYHQTSNKSEKKLVAQVITDVFAARPRYDSGKKYFTELYQLECTCLRANQSLTQSLLTKLLTDERSYNQQVCSSEHCHAAPFSPAYPLVAKQLVCLVGDQVTTVPVHIMETNSSLSMISRLPASMAHSLSELVQTFHITNPSIIVQLHQELLYVAQTELENRPILGADHSTIVQSQLFCEAFVEDPHLMATVCTAYSQQAASNKELGAAERQSLQLQAWCDTLQLITSRHSMLMTATETAILSMVYVGQLRSLDQEMCHAHMRCVPFGQKHTKSTPSDFSLDKPLCNDDDANLDRYSPAAAATLGIHELDDQVVGKFSFHCREAVMKILTTAGGLENLQISLMAEVAHRNCLLIVSQRNSMLLLGLMVLEWASNSSETDGEQVSLSKLSLSCQASNQPAAQLAFLPVKMKKMTFASIQRFKTPLRDHMLNEFANKPSHIFKSTTDEAKARRQVITEYCKNLMRLLSPLSLKTQLFKYYDSLQQMLCQFPATKEAFFMVGSDISHLFGAEPKKPLDSDTPLLPDSRQSRSRPQALLSSDGNQLMNIWFIPHVTEILLMFDGVSLTKCCDALTTALAMVSALHSIVSYTCAYAWLGSSGCLTDSEQGGAEWGGLEGVGVELNDLQTIITGLDDPSSPSQVAECLSLRREVMFLKHELVMRYYLKNTFLSAENMSAFHTLTMCSSAALDKLSNAPRPSIQYPQMLLPGPLTSTDEKSSTLFPWRTFLVQSGPYVAATTDYHDTSSYVSISLAVLSPVDRCVANGELLSMSLLLEEVALSQIAEQYDVATRSESASTFYARSQKLSEHGISRSIGSQSSNVSMTNRARHIPTSMSTLQPYLHTPPLEGHTILKDFLQKSSQLEVLKDEWGSEFLPNRGPCTAKQCKVFQDMYHNKVLLPAKRVIAKRRYTRATKVHLEGDAMDDTISVITDVTDAQVETGDVNLDMIENWNELELREAQITRLLTLLDNRLIQDEIKQLSKDVSLVMHEGERDDTSLPLDLWKKPAMKELTGFFRPKVMESFTSDLQSNMKDKGHSWEISKRDLSSSLEYLTALMLAREKETYQMYASYYEAILRGQYHHLYLKEQEVEHCRHLARLRAADDVGELLMFASAQTHNLILEVTALRAKIAELHLKLSSQQKLVTQHAMEQYNTLVSNLFNTSFSIKAQYERYRGNLYRDVIDNLQEARHKAAEEVRKLKEKLDMPASVEDPTMTTIKADETHKIQSENLNLNKAVLCMRALGNWHSNQTALANKRQLEEIGEELSAARQELLSHKLTSSEEIISYKQQVKTLQKELIKTKKQCDTLTKQLEEERQRKSHPSKSSSKGQEDYPTSKLDQMQSTRINQLVQELEEKDGVLKTLLDSCGAEKKLTEIEMLKNKKTLKQIKQQLTHERTMKHDAFHRVEELLSQVHDLDRTNTRMAITASKATRSTTGIPSHVHHNRAITSHSFHNYPKTTTGDSGSGVSPRVIQRLKSNQAKLRTPTASEIVEMNREIDALKLI
ncbi:uncharacterized protein [Dysidea avara]|uniref:uncharacterized protein isoform X2 n=1 Tax=Dysidea avara TaxID=196820 RepID=UPI00331D483B